MKKLVSILLVLVMVVSMTACGGQSVSDVKSDNQTPPQSTSSEQAESKATNYTVENEVVVDNEYCSVTLASCKEESSSVDLKFVLENKTSDKNIMFSMDNTAVNGWILSSLFAETVASGKKSNETLSFSKSDLSDLDIKAVDKLEFSMRIYDDDDWMADEFVEDTFVVYPTGKAEADIVSPDRWYGNDEMSVVDNDSCSFVVLGTYEDDIWGYTVAAYLENKTADKTLMFSWDNVSVNCYMVDPFWASSVTPGNKKIATINFSSSAFEENDIESVDEIEFSLRVYDGNDWFANDIVNDTFTYNPAQ